MSSLGGRLFEMVGCESLDHIGGVVMITVVSLNIPEGVIAYR